MADQGRFDIKIEKGGETETVTVVMQKISPLKAANMSSEVWRETDKGDVFMTGDLVEKAIEYDVIVSPKNLIERIEEADNGIAIVTEVARQINKFCANPRKYQLFQADTSTETESLGDSV